VTVKRVYTGDEARYYPTLAVEAEPGVEVEFGHGDDVPDDGRWATAADARKQEKKPEPTEESA
jgi:hypothetical protein